MAKIFVSYSHKDSDWVRDRLVPCLDAGGAEALVDYRLFTGGRTVIGQMDATQDAADRQVLVLSKSYHASAMCQHEMARAIAKDPTLNNGTVVVVRRDNEPMPPPLGAALYADLRDDTKADPWTIVMAPCGASLGTTPPHWLEVRDEVVRKLEDHTSVNLVVLGSNLTWRHLLADARSRVRGGLHLIDLEDPRTIPRDGLVSAMMGAVGVHQPVNAPPRDLGQLADVLEQKARSRIRLLHFDLVAERERAEGYGVNLFTTLRNAIMDKKSLTLLAQSRTPFGVLCPKGHPLSVIDVRTVELKANP
jgi:hypothetical protein